MNLVLDNASEVSVKKKTEKPLGVQFALVSWAFFFGGGGGGGGEGARNSSPALLTALNPWPGRILLKGDNITLMMQL